METEAVTAANRARLIAISQAARFRNGLADTLSAADLGLVAITAGSVAAIGAAQFPFAIGCTGRALSRGVTSESFGAVTAGLAASVETALFVVACSGALVALAFVCTIFRCGTAAAFALAAIRAAHFSFAIGCARRALLWKDIATGCADVRTAVVKFEAGFTALARCCGRL